MPKIRVFKTPSLNNAAEIHVGIPSSIQLNASIKSLSMTQVEVLPKPKSLSQLNTVPLEINNTPINAFKNVQKSSLEPGYKIKAVPMGNIAGAIQPLEVEEIVIPDGYVHVDNFSPWEIYNYNQAYFVTNQDFKPLPEEKRLPVRSKYYLTIRGKEFSVKHSKDVDEMHVYYRRISEIQEDYEWVFWSSFSSIGDPVEFPYDGQYIFRAIPFFNKKPIGGYKDYHALYEENEDLNWSEIQISETTYQIRMEGKLNDKINFIEVKENGKLLNSLSLAVDSDGKLEKTFRVTGVSDSKFPRLEYRFYRKKNAFISYRTNAYHNLKKHYAIEPIGFAVNKITDTKFSINITDDNGLLFSPISIINVFSGQDWNKAIQTGKLLCKLQIKRHQDGLVTPYGSYFINVTQDQNPKFINLPPFDTDAITKVSNGIQFEFEDTQAFRETVGLDIPDLDKKLAYEFRLLFWSAGVEESLRTGQTYSFIKEKSILVKNRRRSYKFNYDTWKQEHPRKRYCKITPRDIEYSYLNDHIRYGSSKIAYVMEAGRLPVNRTRDIELEPLAWKVLYYYNDKDDEIQEFPYYSFKINIPESSKLEIEKLDVYIDNETDDDTHLGEYHACDSIEIVDFVGYFKARKLITKKINLQRVLSPMLEIISPSSLATGTRLVPGSPRISASASRLIKNRSAVINKFSPARNIQPTMPSGVIRSIGTSQNTYSSVAAVATAPTNSQGTRYTQGSNILPSMKINTAKKKLEAVISNRSVNNQIAVTVESGMLKYRVEVVYRDKKKDVFSLSVPISDRPKIEEDPPGNSSVTVGNQTFQRTTVDLPSAAALLVKNSISKIPVSTQRSFSTKVASNNQNISRVQGLRGFNK